MLGRKCLELNGGGSVESRTGEWFTGDGLGRRASPVAQMVKSLPAVQENGVQSLGWEDPLEKEMATHSTFLAWKIPWTEKPGGLQFMG